MSMKHQKYDETVSMNTSEDLDSERLWAWWNKQAVISPDSAGILQVYNEPWFGLLYRQEAEWLHFRRIVSLHKDMHVLEFGCGAGRWALRIAPLVSRVIGIDFSEEMINLARERQRSLGLNSVEFCVSAAQDSILETKFDVVYLSGITSYLSDPQLRKTLCHIQTMLAPGGILIDRASISLGVREVYDDGDYQGIYRTIQEQKLIFEEFGFHLTYHAPSYNRMRLPHRLLANPWFQRGMATGLNRLPKATVLFIYTITRMLEKTRPRAHDAASRSHDFFVFNQGAHHHV